MCSPFHLHLGFVLISSISSRTQSLVSSGLVKLHEFEYVLDPLLLLVSSLVSLGSGGMSYTPSSFLYLSGLALRPHKTVHLEKAAEESVHSETFGGMFCGHIKFI